MVVSVSPLVSIPHSILTDIVAEISRSQTNNLIAALDLANNLVESANNILRAVRLDLDGSAGLEVDDIAVLRLDLADDSHRLAVKVAEHGAVDSWSGGETHGCVVFGFW